MSNYPLGLDEKNRLNLIEELASVSVLWEREGAQLSELSELNVEGDEESTPPSTALSCPSWPCNLILSLSCLLG